MTQNKNFPTGIIGSAGFTMITNKIATMGEGMIALCQKGADISRGFGTDALKASVYIAHQVAADKLAGHHITVLDNDSFSQYMLACTDFTFLKT